MNRTMHGLDQYDPKKSDVEGDISNQKHVEVDPPNFFFLLLLFCSIDCSWISLENWPKSFFASTKYLKIQHILPPI